MNPKKLIKFIFIFLIIFSLGFAAGGIRDKFNKSENRNLSHEGHDHEGKNLYTCSMHPFIVQDEPGDCPVCQMDLVVKADDKKHGKKERIIAHWKAPMNPLEIYDSPGKSAMGMDLVPVYEDELVGGVDIKIDPVVVQNMGIKTIKVKEEDLRHTIRTYGHITYDETGIADVSPRFSGWVEDIYVNFNGELVKKGAPLFRVYSPELIRAQEDYLNALRNRSFAGSSIEESAGIRLLNYGLSTSFIKKLKKTKKPDSSILIRASSRGIIKEKNILKGGYFPPGKSLMKIFDISSVWVEAHLFDREIDMVKKGMDVEMVLPFKPHEKYFGKVSYIYPYMEKKTRDVIVRLMFDNKDMELKPDMYADIIIRTDLGRGLVVPDEAIIRSGINNIVFVAKDGGRFIPRGVEIGLPVNGGKTQILTGLVPGEDIVVSGQFMLDSESRLSEALGKMTSDKSPGNSEEDFFKDM